MNANLLLIDGNNLCFRVHWTNRELSYKGTPVSLIYGFYRSFIYLKKKFPEYIPIVVWDKGSSRRKKEAASAVEKGIIPSGYKANRKKDEPDEMLLSLFEQLDMLKDDLSEYIRLQQVTIPGLEADDIIYTYAKVNKGKTIAITSDKDFYQMLDDNVVVYDAMKKKEWTKDVFTEEYGIEPYQWVDVGALTGDKSDNIFGCPGIGPVNAFKFIKEFTTVEGVIEGLSNSKNKLSKKEKAVLDNIEVLRLAKSLKQMDCHPDVLPEYRCPVRDEEKLKEYFKSFGFETLMNDAWRLII